MTKKFTKLMAALALLVFMMPSMAGWGQTRSDITLTANSGFSSSYSSNHTFTFGGISFKDSGVMYNGNGSPNGFSSKQVIQLRKSNNGAGEIFNTTAISTISSIEVTVVNDQRSFSIYYGIEQNPSSFSIASGSLTPVSGSFTYTNTNNQQATATAYTYTFDLSSYNATYFRIQNGSNASYVGRIVINYGNGSATYTVTLADDNTMLTQSAPGASVTLPTRSAIGSYTFAGWSSTNVPDETTTAPTIITAGPYTPTSDITLYPVYTRTEDNGTTTEWHLTNLNAVDAGVYALLTTDYHAFNGNISSGHGQATTDVFSFTDGVATVAPSGVCEITFESVSGGFKMHNATKGYLYASAASSGKLAWQNPESSYWFYGSSNWKYNANNAFLRSYGNNSFRTYGQNNGDVLQLAKKVEVSNSTTYYWSNPTTGPIITATAPATLAYDAAGGEFGYSILNPATGVTLTAASNSDWITNVAVNANNSTVTFSTSTNTIYTQRTGTITLSYTGATDKVVTITQEAAPDPVITASNVEIAFDATSGSIAYSITNEPTPAGTMTAAVASSGTMVNLAIGAIENNAVAFTCAANNTDSERTATVTLTYTYDNNRTVTKNVTLTQAASEFDYAILPFAFDDNADAVANVAGLTQQGLSSYTTQLKLKFDGTGDWLLLRFNERPGQLSYDIKGNDFQNSTFKVQVSSDGVTYTDFATYTNLTSDIQHITHNNLAEDVRYIKWVYTEKVNGNVALGNIALDAYQPPQEYTLTVGVPQNVTIHAFYGDNQSVTNGGTANVLSGSTVTLNMSVHPGYVLNLVTVYDAQDNLISLTEEPDNNFSFIMPNSAVTVSADVIAAHPEYYYTRATSLEPGRRYIIVAVRNGGYLAMGAQKNNNRNAKPISVEGTVATVIRTDVHEFSISSIDNDPGFYSIFDVDGEGGSSGYLYAGSSSSNYLLTETELDANGHWSITVDPETGEGTIIAQGSNTRNVMRFNQDNGLFSCYAAANSDNQYPVYLYMKDDGFDLTIDGYTDVPEGEGDNNKGYYLIASPVTVNPANVAGMTDGDYDLYSYDDSQEKEWINWKGDATLGHPGGFDLVPGKGYLYAKKATTPGETYTFTLSGEVYDGDGTIDLVDGWNLIGNPFNEEVAPSTDYYEMNIDGSEIIAGESWVIAPMQGIFINNEYGETSTSFSILSKGARKAGLSLNLSQGRGPVVDRAIVRFGEGRQLPKFQLFENSTKVYIPQSDKDYAVVRSADEGEMPVNFKAETNGTYTLSMNAEEVNFGYLHLVDNMTGTDVDLLATPSYTFEARTTDYESRFKLVFVCGDANNDNATFAFFNGSGWTVSNMGEATLQVVDVMGRVLSSEQINGCAEIHVNAAAGVYVMRLVNGENVRTQKIIVR